MSNNDRTQVIQQNESKFGIPEQNNLKENHKKKTKNKKINPLSFPLSCK